MTTDPLIHWFLRQAIRCIPLVWLQESFPVALQTGLTPPNLYPGKVEAEKTFRLPEKKRKEEKNEMKHEEMGQVI